MPRFSSTSLELLFGAALVALTALGCSSQAPAEGAASFDGAPIVVMTTDEGALHVEVRASPDPPERGVDAFELFITDPHGAPVDGLALGVVPFMPAHGHGTSLTPIVHATASGHYVVENVDLYMPGRWQLETEISGGTLSTAQHVSPSVDIQ